MALIKKKNVYILSDGSTGIIYDISLSCNEKQLEKLKHNYGSSTKTIYRLTPKNKKN